jgi:hypothetical protein
MRHQAASVVLMSVLFALIRAARPKGAGTIYIKDLRSETQRQLHARDACLGRINGPMGIIVIILAIVTLVLHFSLRLERQAYPHPT